MKSIKLSDSGKIQLNTAKGLFLCQNPDTKVTDSEIVERALIFYTGLLREDMKK